MGETTAVSTLVTLPLHLLETIKQLLATDVELPSDLRRDLDAATTDAAIAPVSVDAELHAKEDDCQEGLGNSGEESRLETQPPIIDVELVERLSRWADGDEGRVSLRRRGLDPSQYLLIPLLAGTEVYLPPQQRDRLLASHPPHQFSPYLPAYLSPSAPSFGKEYRTLSKQLTTLFNVLFSIFGSAFAVYFAATTGAGYSRETATLLGVMVGTMVGVADGVLVWIFSRRLEEGRREARRMGAEMGRGSAGEGLKAIEGGQEEVQGSGKAGEMVSEEIVPKRSLRLRRRGIREVDE